MSRVVRTAGLLRGYRPRDIVSRLSPRDPVLLMVDFDTWSPVAPSLEDSFTGVGRSVASPGLLLLPPPIAVSKLVQVTEGKRRGLHFL